MKTRPGRHNTLIAIAALMIAASLGLYCLLFLKWLGNKPVEAPFSPRAAQPAPEELAAARARFRESYLDPAARLRLAETLYARGLKVDAFYVIKETREFFGDSAFRRAHDQVVLRKDSVAAQAELELSDAGADKLQERLKDQPNDPAVLGALARLAAEHGPPGDALKYADAALAARPTDPGLTLLKAELTAPSDLMAAIPMYARLANAAPGSYEARRSLEALARLAQKKEADPQIEAGHLAQEALQELFKAQPKEPLVFASLATAAWNRGETGAARAMVADALRQNPEHAGALMVDGLIAMADGDSEKALKQFSAAWQRNPDDLYSAEQLARLYDRERGDREAALPYYIALYRENPDFAAGAPVEQIISEILDVRRKALVGRVGSDSLGRFLSSDDGSLRAEACARAGAAKDAQWLDALAELLDDDVDLVRHNADYALYQIAFAKPDLVRARKDEWLQSPRPLLRTRALNLFADLYSTETFPAVETALEDPNPTVRFLTKTMVLDHYYKNLPAAQEARERYLAREKDPEVRALYSRMEKN